MLGTDRRRAQFLLVALIIAAAIPFGWLAKQSYSVYKLTRGVGDTWFHTADGRRWFRLDEQRHDVPISAIAPDLQHAFVAVEDHRFFLHPGVDPIALGRAVLRNVRAPGTVAGRQHADPAAGAHAVPVQSQELRAQGARSGARVLIEAQLSKQQILELYLNRIYLGAGIYGVEAMSQRVFGKPAKNADAGRERADRRAGARTGGAVAMVEPRRGRARSHVVLARMRDERFITDAQYRARAAGAVRVRPYRSDSDAATATQGVSAAAVPRRIRRRSSARLARRDDVRRRAPGCRRGRGRERTRGTPASRRCRRRWWRSIRPPATSSRSSAVATTSDRRSIAPAAAAASPARPSSHSSSPRRSNAACRRSRR